MPFDQPLSLGLAPFDETPVQVGHPDYNDLAFSRRPRFPIARGTGGVPAGG